MEGEGVKPFFVVLVLMVVMFGGNTKLITDKELHMKYDDIRDHLCGSRRCVGECVDRWRRGQNYVCLSECFACKIKPSADYKVTVAQENTAITFGRAIPPSGPSPLHNPIEK